MRIQLRLGQIEVTGKLNDTATAARLWEILPQSSSVQTWGEEVYFSVPLETELSLSATDVVEPGTICFWVEGNSVAIPFGPTPASQGDECRLVTSVNTIGQLEEDFSRLREVRSGDPVSVERLE